MPKTTLQKKEKKVIEILNKTTPKGITIKDEYVIWPSGTKTHMRFIREGIQKMRPLPIGFYAEAKRLNLPNLNLLAAKAKSMNLEEKISQ